MALPLKALHMKASDPCKIQLSITAVTRKNDGGVILPLKTGSRALSKKFGLAVNLFRGILEYWNVGFSGLRSDLTMTYPQ